MMIQTGIHNIIYYEHYYISMYSLASVVSCSHMESKVCDVMWNKTGCKISAIFLLSIVKFRGHVLCKTIFYYWFLYASSLIGRKYKSIFCLYVFNDLLKIHNSFSYLEDRRLEHNDSGCHSWRHHCFDNYCIVPTLQLPVASNDHEEHRHRSVASFRLTTNN